MDSAWTTALQEHLPELQVTYAGGECPVQVEGILESGQSVYFRGRHDCCELYIGDPGTEPPVFRDQDGFAWHGETVGWDDAGRLSPREAAAALKELVDRFTSGLPDDATG